MGVCQLLCQLLVIQWTDTSTIGPIGARAQPRVVVAANGEAVYASRLSTEGGPVWAWPMRLKLATPTLVQVRFQMHENRIKIQITVVQDNNMSTHLCASN